MNCPKCSSSNLSENSLGDRLLCMTCKVELELTPVNSWYKNTVFANLNIEG